RIAYANRLIPLLIFSSLFFTLRRPPRPPLFPYTTLFRSHRRAEDDELSIETVEQRAPFRGKVARTIRRCEDRDGVAQRPEFGREIGRHTSELQSQSNLVCRLLLEKKKKHVYGSIPRGRLS